jgi:hypothetical protein
MIPRRKMTIPKLRAVSASTAFMLESDRAKRKVGMTMAASSSLMPWRTQRSENVDTLLAKLEGNIRESFPCCSLSRGIHSLLVFAI